jgi:uncharacterized membrane protein
MSEPSAPSTQRPLIHREAHLIHIVRRVLAVGTIVAGTTLTLGIVLLLVRGDGAGDWSRFVPSERERGLGGIVRGARTGDAQSVALLGIVLLVLVPAARVLATLWSFARARAWTFVLSGVIVLAVILAGLAGAASKF